MSEQVQPAHCCERCGGENMQSVQTDDCDTLQVCVRCDWILGEELTDRDKLVRELWHMSDETGYPRPEDVRSVCEAEKGPPETYDITEPSEMEAQDQFDRELRLAVAMLDIRHQPEGPDTPEVDGSEDRGGLDQQPCTRPEMGGEFVPDSFF